MADWLATQRRALRLVSLLVAGSLALSSAAIAAPGDTVYQAVMTGISKRVELLDSTERHLEARYGYAGSKATLAAALADAKATGSAQALGGRLYVLWRAVQPFFATQRADLEAHATALRGQGHVPAHDVRWLLRAYGDLEALVQTLTQGLEDATTLAVQGQLAKRAVASATTNLQSSKRAMRGAGSRGVADLLARAEEAVVEAEARVAATSATLMAHEAAIRRDAERRVLPPYVAVAARPTRALQKVLYTGHAAPDPAPGEEPVADAAATTAEAAACTKRIDALALERKGHLAKAQVHLDAVLATERTLADTRAPSDLPEVRKLMGERGELDARIKAKRGAIGDIDLDAPNGREHARKTAEEVLALQAKVPAIDAELTRLRSKAHFVGWRKRTREAIARERAAATVLQQEAERVRHQQTRERIKRLRIEGQIADRDLGAHLARATALARAAERHPKLSLIRVSRPASPGAAGGEAGGAGAKTEDVLVVERQTARALIQNVVAIQAARTALAQAVGTLSGAWEALSKARSLALARPLNLPQAELQATLEAVWKRAIKRLAVKGTGGKTGKVLRRAFATLPDETATSQAQAGVPTGDLALSFERFESTMNSGATRKLLRKLATRELRRFAPKTKDDSPEVEAVARMVEASARRPHLALARHGHAQALGVVAQAIAASKAALEGFDLHAGGRLSVGVPLRVGDPVSVTLGYTGRRRAKCPAIRIGPHPVPLQAKRQRGICSYALDRLDTLPDGDVALHIGSKP